MIYTQNIQKAISFSIKTHEVYQKQKRKGKDVAYITHPLSVGLILARAGATEEVIMAGILHDTIEDSPAEKKVTQNMLVERFGEQVALLVASVSESNKDLSWEERKKEALEQITHFSEGSVLVKSADVISNTSELLEDYKKEGASTFERFNAPQERIVEHTLEVISTLLKRWPQSPLTSDLELLTKELQSISSSSPSTKKQFRVTFQPIMDDGSSTSYVVEAENEDEAQEKGLQQLLLNESDGALVESPLQIPTVEELK